MYFIVGSEVTQGDNRRLLGPGCGGSAYCAVCWGADGWTYDDMGKKQICEPNSQSHVYCYAEWAVRPGEVWHSSVSIEDWD